MARHLDYRTVQRDLYAAYKAGALSYPPGVHSAKRRDCDKCGGVPSDDGEACDECGQR